MISQRKRTRALLFALAAVGVLWGGCYFKGENMNQKTGTVVYIDLEGGFYGIKGDDGEKYNPINLSKEFQQDGLRVRFEAKEAEGVMGFHMWGTNVELIKIEKL